MSEMKLLFVGDVMLGRLVNQVLRRRPPSYPWGDTLPILREADLRICNLECVIAEDGQPWRPATKAFHFRTDARNVEVLKAARIDAVSLANNHILDFGCDAMSEALTILDGAVICHAGAGADIREASAPAILTVGQKKIALIACTDNEPDWEATPGKPGTFYVPTDLNDRRATRLLQLVRQTRETVDLLIAALHWGPNWGYRPPPEHVAFGRALVDAGADIVFGHSPHVFRAVELYSGGVIMYSVGNFIDDYAVDEIERNDRSFIFIVETAEDKVTSLRLYPTVIRDFQARKARGREAEDIATKMKRLCTEYGTRAEWLADKGYLEMSGRGG